MDTLRRVVVFSFFLLLWLFPDGLQAQDLIVTIHGDSLNVSIQKENDQFVYYRSKKSKRKDLIISRKEVLVLTYGYYSASAPKPPVEVQDSPFKMDQPERIQLWGSGGFAYYLIYPEDEDPDYLDDYYKKLRPGYTFSFGANFMISEKFGMGAVFEQSAFQHKLDGLVGVTLSQPGKPDTLLVGTQSEDITIRYIGLNFLIKFPSANSHSSFYLVGGLGQNAYKNEASLVDKYTLEGTSIGASLGVEYHLSLGGGLYMPIGLNIKSVGFTKMKIVTSPDMYADLAEILDYIYSNLENTPITGTRASVNLGLLYAF